MDNRKTSLLILYHTQKAYSKLLLLFFSCHDHQSLGAEILFSPPDDHDDHSHHYPDCLCLSSLNSHPILWWINFILESSHDDHLRRWFPEERRRGGSESKMMIMMMIKLILCYYSHSECLFCLIFSILTFHSSFSFPSLHINSTPSLLPLSFSLFLLEFIYTLQF